MEEEFVSTFVRADPDAREFIRARGGEVYAWAGADGMMKVGFQRPADVVFVELRADGFTLFQDATIGPSGPKLGWHVSLRRWPRRRIKVAYATPDWGIDLVDVLTHSPWP